MERAPLNALQVFVTAARLENMTRASEQLHLTVSALSHQVRLLEQRLNCTLFVRGPRGLKTTAEGALLLQRVGPHLDAIEAALRPLCTRRSDVLSLSALPSMASSWLVPRLPRFFAANPELEFNLDSSVERVDFADGRFDGALRYGLGEWEGVRAELLFEEWLTPVASPALLEKQGRPRLHELGSWPLLCPDDPWARWFDMYGGTPPRRFVATFSDSETLQRAALEGMGIALGRATMARPLIESGRLVALFPQTMKARYAHYLVYPPRSNDYAGFQTFRRWVLAEAAAFRAATDARPASAPPPRDVVKKKNGDHGRGQARAETSDACSRARAGAVSGSVRARGRAWALCAVASASMSLAFPSARANAATGEPIVNESTDYRDIDGDTEAMLVSSLQRSAIAGDGGRSFYGRTNWQLAWNFSLYGDDASCRIDHATITLSIATSLPRWVPPASAPRALVARWNTFIAALRTHENGHRALALDAARAVAQRIDALPAAPNCSGMKPEIKRAAETTLEEYRAKEKAYDAETAHGRTQGATFP